jgi:hypothetical protein
MLASFTPLRRASLFALQEEMRRLAEEYREHGTVFGSPFLPTENGYEAESVKEADVLIKKYREFRKPLLLSKHILTE